MHQGVNDGCPSTCYLPSFVMKEGGPWDMWVGEWRNSPSPIAEDLSLGQGWG